MNELRFAVRSLARSPWFSLATILTLALGIGAATAIFSAADRLLFRPLPYPAPERLFVLGYNSKSFGFMPSQQGPQLAAYRDHAVSFSALAAFESRSLNLVVDGAPSGVLVGRVSLDHFATLGAIPILGRTFLPGEDRAGADNVLVLSHQFWRKRFGRDRSILGQDVLLDGRLCRVVGVLAENYQPPPLNDADIYQPLVLTPDAARPFAARYYVIARLKPYVMPAHAEAELASIEVPVSGRAAQLLAERKPQLVRLADVIRPRASPAHATLLAAVGFLYVIACVNAANLLLARLHARRKELSIRLAVGSSRSGLLGLVVVENLLLTLLAGATGALVAQWIFPALLRFWPEGVRSVGSASLDWRAVGFMAALTVLTGLLVSLTAVWAIARANVANGLKESGQAVGESRRLQRSRSALVVVEAGFAVTLLIGAGLIFRTVQQLQAIDRGFDPTDKVAVLLQIPGNLLGNAYSAPAARRQFYENLEQQLRAIPGVEEVAMTAVAPMAGTYRGNVRKPDGTEFYADFNPVSPGYRQVLGLRLLKGRWFDDAAKAGEPVVVINQTMAREYFGPDDPLGRSFALNLSAKAVPWQVIGIVADVRQWAKENPRPQFYYPYWQRPADNVATVLLRLTKPPDPALGDAVRRAVYAVDPLVATMPLRPLTEAAAVQIAQERYTLAVLQVLSALALGLAVAGLFAVMSYAVTQRMGEFGVRLALGATPRQLFRMVLGRGVSLASGGVILGTGLAWALTRFLQSLLYETSAHDPLTYIAVAAILICAAMLGCWIPARRAMRVDVAKLLRVE